MADYLTAHHSGAWRYQLHIPKKLQPMLGKKTAFVRYIPRCPRRQAEAIAHKWALDDRAEMEAHKNLSPHEQERLKAGGGWDRIVNAPAPDQEQLAVATKIETKINRHMPSNIAEVSWDALLAEWIRCKQPTRPRNHAATIKLLKAHFGERNCREITPNEIGAWRDSMQDVSRARVRNHLKHLTAIYSAVQKEPTSKFYGMTNPAKGVFVLGKNPVVKDGRDRAFSPQQVKTILETAERVRFGKHRHTQVLWGLRLLAYTGARPNEIFQLQRNDVMGIDGIKVIRICNTDALTNKPHPDKTAKTGERLVPLHKDVAGFSDYARSLSNGDDFIFGAFPANKDNGRASWLITYFGDFLRDDCKIVAPHRRLSLYGLRHAFHDSMDRAMVPDKIQRRLVGHTGRDIHSHYGGADLKLLADYMAKINPCG